MIIVIPESHYSQVLEFLIPSMVTWKKNVVFHTNLVTTVLNILFQGVCSPQRISKTRQILSALCHWLPCGPSQHRHRTRQTGMTICEEVTGIVCVIWLDKLLLSWHLHQEFLFTLHLCGQLGTSTKEGQGWLSVSWLAANDPPELCWDKIISSIFNCKYNLQFIEKCITTCITWSIFTVESSAPLCVTLLVMAVLLLLPFWPGLTRRSTAFATTDVNSQHSLPFKYILHWVKQKVF